jgi:hypothetical protein
VRAARDPARGDTMAIGEMTDLLGDRSLATRRRHAASSGASTTPLRS